MMEHGMKTLLLVLVPLSAFIAVCSDDKPTKVKEDTSLSGMVESQAQGMQKARELEGVLLDADKRRRDEVGE
jgi:hypothetical protein